MMKLASVIGGFAACVVLTQCGPVSNNVGHGTGGVKLGGPTQEERDAKIAAEPAGNYFVGRRYFVEKTRFWGYIRKPREPWSRAKLVLMDESRKHVPDRFSENGPPGKRYAQDANREYRVTGGFTGREGYDPNSNQFLPIFQPTGFTLVDSQPGWLFTPEDRYDRYRITMLPR